MCAALTRLLCLLLRMAAGRGRRHVRYVLRRASRERGSVFLHSAVTSAVGREVSGGGGARSSSGAILSTRLPAQAQILRFLSRGKRVRAQTADGSRTPRAELSEEPSPEPRVGELPGPPGTARGKRNRSGWKRGRSDTAFVFTTLQARWNLEIFFFLFSVLAAKLLRTVMFPFQSVSTFTPAHSFQR